MPRSGPRVTSACGNCKQRRSKCNGARPKCSRCVEVSRECNYDGVDLRKSRHTHIEFSALHNRIAYLEQRVRWHESRSGNVPSISNTFRHNESTKNGCESDLGPSIEPFKFDETSSHNRSQELDNIFTGNALDTSNEWMLELPILPWDADRISFVRSLLSKKGSHVQVDQETGQTIYVGPTSNHHLRTTVTSQAAWLTPIPDGEISLQEPHSLSPEEMHLLHTFRVKVHPTFPILCEGFHPLDSQLIHQASSHKLLLYIMLAVAAFFLDEELLTLWDISRETLIDYYSKRLTAIVGYEIENCCLQNVKAFFLKAYLDALRGRLQAATVYNSIACAMVKRLGLHVSDINDETPAFETDPLQKSEKKERYFIFWAALWLDRRIAILEGRSCHIDHIDISCPRPLAFLKGKETFSELPLSLNLIYACHVELFYLQDITLSKLYSFSDSVSKDDAISEGHLKYISWFASLPLSMKDIPSGRSFHSSFLSFHLSFHSALILLHRRSLSDDGRTAELANQRCQESAATITSLIKSYRDHFGHTLSDPLILHAAFNSALVHLVLLLQPDIVTYRSSLNALRTLKQIIFGFTTTSPPSRMVLKDLQEFAIKWDLSPANSPTFWTCPLTNSSMNAEILQSEDNSTS